MLVRAHDDRVDVTREHARGVLGRLAPADHELVAGAKSVSPPSCVIATSKETRVRRLGFSKRSTSVRPRSNVRPGARDALEESGKREQRGSSGREVRDLEEVAPAQGMRGLALRHTLCIFIHMKHDYATPIVVKYGGSALRHPEVPPQGASRATPSWPRPSRSIATAPGSCSSTAGDPRSTAGSPTGTCRPAGSTACASPMRRPSRSPRRCSAAPSTSAWFARAGAGCARRRHQRRRRRHARRADRAWIARRGSRLRRRRHGVRSALINLLLAAGYLPVVAPLAVARDARTPITSTPISPRPRSPARCMRAPS